MNVGRMIFQDVTRDGRRGAIYRRLQFEASSRPESKRVQTPIGEIYMSPIEAQLYEAMQAEGLSPIPQYCISGYFVDFAFPDVWVAIEADGAAYHEGARQQRDQKRDWILRRNGWTVKRFHGTTIYHKAGNCAYVIKAEVESRRAWAAARAAEEARRRQARRDAILRPFRAFHRFVKGLKRT